MKFRKLLLHMSNTMTLWWLGLWFWVSQVVAQGVDADGVYRGDDGIPVVTLRWIETLFANVLAIMLQLIGVGSFIMLIVGSLKYLFSGGDPKNTESAQLTISWAVGGLGLALGVWFLLRLLAWFTGTDATILNFQLYYDSL